jgi:hypothetical protein
MKPNHTIKESCLGKEPQRKQIEREGMPPVRKNKVRKPCKTMASELKYNKDKTGPVAGW